jgi:hypothetical protein
MYIQQSTVPSWRTLKRDISHVCPGKGNQNNGIKIIIQITTSTMPRAALGLNCIPLTNAWKSNNIRVYDTMITLFEQGFPLGIQIPKAERVIEI